MRAGRADYSGSVISSYELGTAWHVSTARLVNVSHPADGSLSYLECGEHCSVTLRPHHSQPITIDKIGFIDLERKMASFSPDGKSMTTLSFESVGAPLPA